MGRLSGKTAIVTGGNAGVGRGVALAFAEEGANICICARRADKLEATATELRELGARVISPTCDLLVHDDLQRVVDATIAEFGSIDILVNNAITIPGRAPIESLPLDQWDIVMKSGPEATFLLMQKCFPYLKAARGSIINMSSSSATRGSKNVAYAAAKAAIEGISKAAALEWFKFGIQVNCISPAAWSEGWERAVAAAPPEKQADPNEARGAKPRVEGWYIGDPQRDVGPAAVYLASDESKFVTGHVIYVDGGQNLLGI